MQTHTNTPAFLLFSSAAIVAGIVAGLTLLGDTRAVNGKEELLQLCSEIEHHIDNISPCIYGGLRIGYHNGSRWCTTPVQVGCWL